MTDSVPKQLLNDLVVAAVQVAQKEVYDTLIPVLHDHALMWRRASGNTIAERAALTALNIVERIGERTVTESLDDE